MTEDGTPASAASHPIWCDPTVCTTAEYGSHQSASQVVPADPPVSVVAELHLVSALRGLSPDTLLMLEFGIDDDAAVVPLTLSQARQLHAALDKLLAAGGA
jgi:hypothetical protein